MWISSLSCAGRVWAGLTLGVLAGAPDPLGAAISAAPLPGSVAAPAAVAPESEFSAESIAAKRAVLKQGIAATRAQLVALPERGSDESARWLTQETALLERLDAVHAEQCSSRCSSPKENSLRRALPGCARISSSSRTN